MNTNYKSKFFSYLIRFFFIISFIIIIIIIDHLVHHAQRDLNNQSILSICCSSLDSNETATQSTSEQRELKSESQQLNTLHPLPITETRTNNMGAVTSIFGSSKHDKSSSKHPTDEINDQSSPSNQFNSTISQTQSTPTNS